MIRRDDGLVKVLDFGLAKVTQPISAAGSEVAKQLMGNTAPGVVMGTVAYMSPEQARGASVDERTDIWSLGVILYEMVAGCAPFIASSSNEIISAILSKAAAPPLARYAHEVPPRLEEIVEKALSKNRNERYQTSKDLLIDLKRLKQSLKLKAGIERGTSAGANDGPQIKTEGRDAAIVNTRAAEAGLATLGSAQSTSSAEYIVNQVKHHKRGAIVVLASLVIVALGIYFIFVNHRFTLTEKDTILLADFVNTTGDAAFDGSTLKQALAVQLRQTPFLNLFPEEGVRETLRYMGHPEDEHITPQVGREICRRRGLKALLVGTIASLGRNYAITLEAVNGQTGETIASQQIEAEGKEQVLKSLGQATVELRKQLGESLSTLQKYDAPIEQATTSSLEALNVYSKGLEQIYSGNYRDALPLFNKAVELDPNFAEGYVWLSWTWSNLGDSAKTASFAEKAYALRDRVTELEKLHIDEIYHLYTTGDFEKQKEADELIVRLYPNDWLAHGSLMLGYNMIGQHEKAVAEGREAIRLNPNEVHLYWLLSWALISLNRFDEAREVIGQGEARKLDLPSYRRNRYAIAFVQHDAAAMQQLLELMRKTEGEDSAILTEASTVLFEGRWREAQRLFNQAKVSSAQPNAIKNPASLPLKAVIARALFGFCPSTADSNALALARLSSPLFIMFPPIQSDGSLCGDISDKQRLADEQANRYPGSIHVNVFSLPIVRAAIALRRNQPDQAIEYLKEVGPYEGGNAGFWPSYLRGQAYLRLHRSSEAAAEFQRILDHRGWDALSPMYPLAHLGLARALSLAGNVTGSRKSYQDFFALWKDADSDLPVLIDARKQYEQLK
jgi:tetratricopeptide (TPR) repeat protein